MGCASGKEKQSDKAQQPQNNNQVSQTKKQENNIPQLVEIDQDERASKFLQLQTPNNGSVKQQDEDGQDKMLQKQENEDDKHTASVDNIRQYYKIGKVIGNGSFGTIRGCQSKFEESRVGTKAYLLRRELDILKALDHPNIIKFYEIYMDDMYIHFVMEYGSGGDLYNYVTNNGPFSDIDAAKIIQKAISAVNHMHERGIVHRDIKPENILFSTPVSNEQLTDIKLIDFGLSRKFSNIQLSDMPSIVGTPLYVAPEVVYEKPYGVECDCWSLGVVLYYILSGKEPFYASTINEVYNKIKIAQFNYDDDCWNLVSEEAKDFINKLLVVDRDQRYTCKQALAHPWLKKYDSKKEFILNPKKQKILKKDVQNILKFNQRLKLKQEAIKILINHYITNSELNRLHESFQELDKNKTGNITVENLLKVMTQVGLEDQQNMMRDVLKQMPLPESKNPDEIVLNYSDFISAAMNLKRYLNEEKLWTLFTQFDVQNKGYFDIEDIKSVIAREGRKCTNQYAEGMLKEIGFGPTAQITFDNFKEIMKKDVKEEDLQGNASSLLSELTSKKNE